MTKKQFVQPDAETENADWKKFKSQSDQKIASNEKRVGEFKEQSIKISKNLRESFNKKVSDLERKNTALKGKMKDYLEDRTEKQEKFKDEFKTSMNKLSE